MTDTVEPRASSGDVRLTAEMRPGWTPKEIVYTRLTLDPTVRTAVASPRSYVVRQTDVESFVRARLAGLPLPGHVRTRHWNATSSRPDRPINTYVGAPCWVVMELDGLFDWHFEPKQPGITAKHEYGDDNGGLVHVMPDGKLEGHLGPTGEGCRILYFGVNARDTTEHQEFRFHVVSGKHGLQDPDQIDPDIPNDGGKFPLVSEWDTPGQIDEADV